MKYHAPHSAILAAKVASFLFYNDFHYPQPIKGRYEITSSKKEKLKWAYRCWVRQLEKAEKRAGIEAYFAGQELDFSLPDGWKTETSTSVSAAGDLMAVDCLTEQFTSHLFDGIREFYLSSDLTCANLESIVWDKAPLGRNQVYGKAAKMNTSEGMLNRFWQDGAGINYFSTANNHCYDYGEEGLFATLDNLDRRGALHSGTNRTQEEQDSVLVIERNGIRIALLAYTCDTNGNAYEKKYMVNEVRFNDETPDLSFVERQVQKATKQGADVIVAFPHWGWEFEMYPHRSVMETAHRMMEMGVDIILGAHPHVAQPMERYCCADGRQCFAVYSLGDFVSWHPLSRNSKLTYVLRFDLVKGTDADGTRVTRLTNLKALPIYILCREEQDGAYDCRLLPFCDVMNHPEAGLTGEEYADLPRLEQKVLRGILMPRKSAPVWKY